MNNKSVVFYFHAPHYLRNFLSVIRNLRVHNRKIYIIIDEKYGFLTKSEIEDFRLPIDIVFLHYGKHMKFKRIPFCGILLYYFFYKRWCLGIFKKLNVESLVLSDDRGINACILLAATLKLPVKKILLPVESYQSEATRILVRAQQKFFVDQNVKYRLLKRFYPHNFRTVSGKIIYWYSTKNLICLSLIGSLPKNPWLRGFNSVDLVAVSSKAQYQENIAHGMSKSIQSICGFPMHDQIAYVISNNKKTKQSIEKKYILHNDKKILLIVGTTYKQLFGNRDFGPYYKETKSCIETMVQYFSNDFNFIYKLHPRENIKTHESLIGKQLSQFIHVIPGNIKIYPFLGVSDLVFIFLSSTVIGSLALDCPIVCYNLGNLKHFEPFYEPFQSIYKSYNLSDLETCILKIKQKDELTKKRNIDRQNYGMFSGKSTEMVIDLIRGYNSHVLHDDMNHLYQKL